MDALEQDIADADADLVVLVDAGSEHTLAHGQEHGNGVEALRVALAPVEDNRVAAHHEGGPVLQQPPEELLLGRAHHVIRVDQGGLALEREQAGRGEGELQPTRQEVKDRGRDGIPGPWGPGRALHRYVSTRLRLSPAKNSVAQSRIPLTGGTRGIRGKRARFT